MYVWSLKNEIVVHLLAVVVLFVPFTILHLNVGLPLLFLWIGAIVGTFLPDLDHFIYTLFLKPNEITSQRVRAKVANKDVKSTVSLLFSTRDERKQLIFHTLFFQCMFVVFAFLIVSSSVSLFGRGLVLAFLLSLLVDQYLDLKKKGNLHRWGYLLPLTLTPEQFNLYLGLQALLILLFAYVW